MEELLKKYILNNNKGIYENIDIKFYDFDGAICFVEYLYEGGYRETTNINIWDMLEFLNEKIL